MEEEIRFRQAEEKDKDIIWGILQQAIERRKNDGSNQWQDGYPNLQTVENDIAKGQGYVLTLNDEVITYAALIFNDEPAYENIKGEWLTNGDFMVVHRVAVSDKAAGKGIVKKFFGTLDDFARSKKVYSIKVDTNFDNLAMLAILEKLGYAYCGEVVFRESARKAFEKVLTA
ncbi:GNAT family N-acetyltransferase [Elizabethkingia occulta]|uniref:GCN5 family acetyltransferase n=1 Tax=Elizabethkingia occulta TaxID=1867263 RepID=A0A1T3MGN5_9FLAO|nr:GNAT family N-acetyltransferase [Elizabethkingia occulta]OPB94267.1 GCN5 family acetyltransferase [Elizabethkingia occulta]OPC63440.1 GCN5 family acetyltransferase [Elizabethkingia occulta]